MIYHAPTKSILIQIGELEGAANHLLYALANVRTITIAGLPLERYERGGSPLTDACFAQISIIEAAEIIGINLGVTRQKFNELDLRNFK